MKLAEIILWVVVVSILTTVILRKHDNQVFREAMRGEHACMIAGDACANKARLVRWTEQSSAGARLRLIAYDATGTSAAQRRILLDLGAVQSAGNTDEYVFTTLGSVHMRPNPKRGFHSIISGGYE